MTEVTDEQTIVEETGDNIFIVGEPDSKEMPKAEFDSPLFYSIRNKSGSGWKLEYFPTIPKLKESDRYLEEYNDFIKELELITLSYSMDLVKDIIEIKYVLIKYFKFYLLQNILKLDFNIKLIFYENAEELFCYYLSCKPLAHNFAEAYEDVEELATQTITFKINSIKLFR